MQIFTDPFLGKASATLLLGAGGVLAYFALDIFLFVTRHSFGNVNINVAIFTRRDHSSTTNKLRYKSIDTNVPLRDILRNRYLFWYVIFRGFCARLETPVLNFHSHTHAVLSPIRGRAARPSAGMEYKRLAGMPYIEKTYQLCIVYDRSEDKTDRRTRILRVILIPQDVFDGFDAYLLDPPHNSSNWDLMKRIKSMYVEKTGSFINVDITTA